MITRLDVNAVTADGTFLQGKLTAGENVTISGDVISATGGGGTTIDSTTDLSCNTLTTTGNATIGGVITAPNQPCFKLKCNVITRQYLVLIVILIIMGSL